MTKKDYIYNGVYLTILVAYYFFNVEVFDYTFKETELCDELKETMIKESLVTLTSPEGSVAEG